MRALLALLLLCPLPAHANPLAHTTWVEAGRRTCAGAIYFGVRRYLFLNPCHAPAPDGVIERGTYALAGDLITLANRQPATAQGLDGIPPEVREMHIEALTADRLALRVGGRSLRFRSGRAGVLRKAAGSR